MKKVWYGEICCIVLALNMLVPSGLLEAGCWVRHNVNLSGDNVDCECYTTLGGAMGNCPSKEKKHYAHWVCAEVTYSDNGNQDTRYDPMVTVEEWDCDSVINYVKLAACGWNFCPGCDWIECSKDADSYQKTTGTTCILQGDACVQGG